MRRPFLKGASQRATDAEDLHEQLIFFANLIRSWQYLLTGHLRCFFHTLNGRHSPSPSSSPTFAAMSPEARLERKMIMDGCCKRRLVPPPHAGGHWLVATSQRLCWACCCCIPFAIFSSPISCSLLRPDPIPFFYITGDKSFYWNHFLLPIVRFSYFNGISCCCFCFACFVLFMS